VDCFHLGRFSWFLHFGILRLLLALPIQNERLSAGFLLLWLSGVYMLFFLSHARLRWIPGFLHLCEANLQELAYGLDM